MRSVRLLALASGAVLVFTLVALKLLPAPWVWICVTWTAVGLAGAATLKPMGVRLACLAASAVVVGLGAIEAWLWIVTPPHAATTVERSQEFYDKDSVLGWRLAPGKVTRVVERLDDSVLYDVSYGIDAAGRRRAYPDTAAPARGCAFFFVCSFTFGEGVQDEETLPYRVGARTVGRFRAVNFAAPGWGAEHMLAALERGVVQAGAPCAPTHIIYQTLPHHVERAAGRATYAQSGPRYALRPDGTPAYAGQLQPPPEPSGLAFTISEQARKSLLFARLTEPAQRDPPRDDVRLYLALVRRARDLFAAQYPRAQFHVLAWSLHDFYAGGFDSFADSLRAIAPNFHSVRDILPDYQTTPERYQIHRRDAHPNALAYDLLAQYVARQILGVPQP